MAQLAKTYTTPAEVLFNSTELGTPKDLNELQQLVRRNFGFLADAAFSGGAQLRCFGDALKVTADGATMDLTVTGLAPILWKLAADPGAPDPQVLLHQLGADDTFTVDAADGSNPRIDILSAKVEDADLGDPEARIVKDGATGVISQQPALNKRSRTKLTVTYTPGVAAAAPVAPAAPAGEVVIAEVLVATGVALLNQADVTDKRSVHGRVKLPLSFASAQGTAAIDSASAVLDALEFADLPVSLPVGAVIRSLVFFVSDDGGGEIVHGNLYRTARAAPGAPSDEGGAISSGVGEVEASNIDHTVLEDSNYYVRILGDGGAVSATTVSYVELTVDLPT